MKTVSRRPTVGKARVTSARTNPWTTLKSRPFRAFALAAALALLSAKLGVPMEPLVAAFLGALHMFPHD